MKGMVIKKMGVMDKLINYMKLNEDDEEYYDDDDYDEDEDEIEEPVPSSKKHNAVKETEEIFDKSAKKGSSTKITQMRQPTTRKVSAGNGMEVCVIKPTSVEDAREITETLLANRTVVLNLEGADVDIAQRIIDFTSGSCYAINGNLQKISQYIFIITPATVDISGDFQDIFTGNMDAPIN